ncbi:MAG: GNAT family N-acetyltransferase, partial [Nostoc sp.]
MKLLPRQGLPLFVTVRGAECGLHRIFATCRPENIASARVLQKIGMQQEGYLREHHWIKGEW